MENIFPCLRSPRVAVKDTPTSPGSSSLGSRMPHYEDEDMGVIHQAASVGKLWRMRKILLFRKNCLNDRDRMSRTALHVACGKGHPGVVRLLARRHCQLNLWDIDGKTALIHAVQYKQEECAAILLDHGADPNVRDIHGNTALHYAVLGHNKAIVEKLISCMADMEVRNKDDFTPLSLAKYENKEKMVQFLVTRGSTAQQMEGNQQPTSEEKEKRRPLESSASNNLVTHLQKSLKQAWSRRKSKKVCKISEEDCLCRNGSLLWCCTFYSKRRIAVSCPETDNVVFKVVEENRETTSKREVSANTYDGANDDSDRNGLRHQSKKKQTDTQQPNDKINENTVFLVNKVEEQKKQTNSKREVSGNRHAGAEDNSDSVGVRKKINTEQSDKQQLPNKENKDSDRNGFLHWCCGFYSKRRIAVSCSTSDSVICKFEGEKKQTSSKKEVAGNIYAGAGDVNDRNGLRHQRNSKQTDTQKPIDNVKANKVFLMKKVEKKKEQTSSKKKETGNINDGNNDSDSDGLSQHSNREQTDNQQPNVKFNENTDILMNKVEEIKEQKISKMKESGTMYDGADDDSDNDRLSQHSNKEQTDTQQPHDKINENAVILMNKVEEQKKSKREVSGNRNAGAEDNSDSVDVRKKSNTEQSDKQQLPIKENKDSDRLTLQKEKERRQKAGLLYTKNKAQLRKKEGQSMKTVEMSPKVENTIETQVMALETVTGNKVVEERNYTQRQLSQEQNASTLQDGILTKHPCKPKGIERAHKKVISEFEGEKKQTSSKKEVAGNIYAGAGDDSDRNGLRHQRNSIQTDTQKPNDNINANTLFLMNKVEEQKKSKKEVSGNRHAGAEDNSDSVDVRKKSNPEQSDKQQLPIKENKDSDRLTLQKEKEKRQKAGLLYTKNKAQLRKKEGQSMKTLEMNPKVENTIETQVMALETVTGNKVVEERNYTQRQLSQEQNASILQDGILTKHPCKPKGIERANKKVISEDSDSYEKVKCLLHENRTLKDEIAKLTLEVDTVKNQIQEMEKKYFEDTVIVKEQNEHLQKTVTETLFQHNEQLEVLRAERTMLSTKLESEQQNRGRLEAEGDKYRSRQATVIQHHVHCQTSEGDLQVALKKEKEFFSSQEKKNSDMSNLKCHIEMLSQQLSKCESKVNHLEIELHHTKDALRERTSVVGHGEGDQSQTQSQKEDIEHVYQQEPGKVNKDTEKQESLQKRLCHLQSENKLLQQQQDQAHNKADGKRKRVIRIQDQLADTIKILQANSESQGLMLKETCKELINEWNILKEKMHQYENEKAERDAVVRQLQGELADTQKKLSSTEALLKIESHHRMDSQNNIQELRKELHESRSQFQYVKKEIYTYIDLNISLQQSLNEVIKQKSDLEKSMTRAQEPLNMPRRNINEEHSSLRVVNPSLIEMEMETRRLKEEIDELEAASKCPEENTDQVDLDIEAFRKKYDELMIKVEWRRQETKRVRRQMELSRINHEEEERRLESLGECANPYLAYRLEQVRQTFQVSDSYEKQKCQLYENHMLKDKIAKLTLELDTVKYQIQEMEKKYSEDIVIIKEQNEHLQKTITETLFQHNEQLEVLRAEHTMLSTKLESEKPNGGRLEAEGDSYRSRQATVIQHHVHCQTSEGDQQVALEKEKEKCFCSQEKMNSDISNLKYHIEMLSQQLSKCENKSNNLEIELDKIQDQLADTIEMLQANSEKQDLILKESCKELINEWQLLLENIHLYDNEKAEKDAVVSQLQGELADTQRKLSSTEALLKIESHHVMDSQYKIQELQKELHESRSQFQQEKRKLNKYIDLNISLQQSLLKVIKQKRDSEKSMTRVQEPLNMPKRNFNEENNSPRVVKPSLIEMEMETRRLKQETDEHIAASECTHCPEEAINQLELEFQVLQQKCDEMMLRVVWLKKEAKRIRTEMEMSRAKHQEEEHRLETLGDEQILMKHTD